MRTTGAVLLIIGILALAIVGLSFQADSVRDTAVTNGTNETAAAWNLTTDVTETAGAILPPLMLIGGVGAAILTAAGLIVTYSGRGR